MYFYTERTRTVPFTNSIIWRTLIASEAIRVAKEKSDARLGLSCR